jgi:hypothetical protein
MSKRSDPKSDDEWQEAVDLANFCLILDSCRQYGLLENVPDIDIARCEDLIRRGKQRGFEPRDLLKDP